jgi:hypothetical protein
MSEPTASWVRKVGVTLGGLCHGIRGWLGKAGLRRVKALRFVGGVTAYVDVGRDTFGRV